MINLIHLLNKLKPFQFSPIFEIRYNKYKKSNGPRVQNVAVILWSKISILCTDTFKQRIAKGHCCNTFLENRYSYLVGSIT